ncbi:hypothetical protein, partial [Streptomyces sp. NPDC085659]|uniref:hypothetical protein n=1 Tax=Streptomyces sp. NPDC085659 TaxID=3155177 RepID=UPI00344ED39E
SLIELGRADEAVGFATAELELAQALTDRVVGARPVRSPSPFPPCCYCTIVIRSVAGGSSGAEAVECAAR